MANFKHKKPRQSRSGCHMCKPHKILGNSKSALKPSEKKEAWAVLDAIMEYKGLTA